MTDAKNEGAGGASASNAVLGVETYEQWAIFYRGNGSYSAGYVRHGTMPKLFNSEAEARQAINPANHDKSFYKAVQVSVSVAPNASLSGAPLLARPLEASVSPHGQKG